MYIKHNKHDIPCKQKKYRIMAFYTAVASFVISKSIIVAQTKIYNYPLKRISKSSGVSL